MMKNKGIAGVGLAWVALMATSANAAYPKQMDVTIEFWNDAANDLQLDAATWFPAGADLSAYGMPADQLTETFKITLANPRNDSAGFSVRDGGKLCVFTLSHEKAFSWAGINPAPEKRVTANSAGAVPAQCSAEVIEGHKSMGAYSARLRMK